MRYRWSTFQTQISLDSGNLLLKSTLTDAVVSLTPLIKAEIDALVSGDREMSDELSSVVRDLVDPAVALLILDDSDEFSAWRSRLTYRRDDEAHIFILHFLPTIQCQLECDYCFENGADRGKGMEHSMVGLSRVWLDEYFAAHPEINTFRLVIFGGEPLLRKDIVRNGLEAYHALAREHNLEFWCELTSNGELLDEQTAAVLASHNWRRVQITLDGPEDLHDRRRHGRHQRPTFQNIMRNVDMLLATDYINHIDIRISLDSETADRVPELIHYLAARDAKKRINLNLGMVTATFQTQSLVRIGNASTSLDQFVGEERIAEKALVAWAVAKECGYKTPEEYITGPWCVAIAKHSAILQPDGTLQKCFCTAGRPEYNFGTITEHFDDYLKDERYEHFRRTDQCIEESCQFLPLCGGGCIHDAVVSHGGAEGFTERFCQKTLLQRMNEGLLRLRYT